MLRTLDTTIEILEALVGFESVSGRPTHGIVGYIQDYLEQHGIPSNLSFDGVKERANIFATIGPEIDVGSSLMDTQMSSRLRVRPGRATPSS